MAKETTRPVLVYDFVYSHFFLDLFYFFAVICDPSSFFFLSDSKSFVIRAFGDFSSSGLYLLLEKKV